MSGISTSIELYDRVSAPIYKMLGALDNLTSTFESVESSMDGSFDTSQIESARRAIEEAASDVARLGQGIERNEQEQHDFNRAVRSGTSEMDSLMGKVAGLVATYASLQTAGKVMDVSDELTQTTARIDMMNDGLQTTPELVNLIYKSSQNARGSFSDMAAVVAKFGNNARDAFGSSEEVVSFANLIQKQMTIAGASTAEASNAMLQLSQALGSGTLRGDELNSIFEQAPNLVQSIADYLDVPIGKIREMAQEGQLSAQIVKNAIFSAADDINAQFEQMPMTWGQVWTVMSNAALMQFQPVLNKVNELANDESFQQFASNAISALAVMSMYLLEIMEFVGMVGSFFIDNWSIISPIIWGVIAALSAYLMIMTYVNLANKIHAIMETVRAAKTMMATGATLAATAAQHGLNAALLASPMTWIIVSIITIIAIIYAVCAAIAKLTNIANSGFGVITGGINVVIQFFKNLGLTVANIGIGIGNAIGALASNMMTAFNNAICSIQSWFYGLLSDALTVVEGICKALNKLPFVEFDYSGISSKADAYAKKASEAAGNKEDYQSISDAFNEGFSTFDTFQDGWATDAYKSGAAWGDGAADKVSDAVGDFFAIDEISLDESGLDTSNLFDGGGYEGMIPTNIDDIALDTESINDKMDITSEDLKYLRDIAEREVVNRFTTAEIKVEMTNNNNVSSDMDLDGIIDYLANGVNEAMEMAAEGVHA
jgi:tape measure domain-containing protein